MGKQFLVIDGADEGRFWRLHEGTLRIGSSRRDTDICLHDLYVARVHCQVEVKPDRIVVTDTNDKSGGTFVNGQRITEHELRIGDVLRVGNSHLRLQAVDGDLPQEVKPEERPAPVATTLPRLPAERLHELTDHVLGHFEIGSVLGKGHCGVVFRARDVKAQRTVALKVLSPQFPSNQDEMNRFVQAIRAMPARHPHLVSLLGAGKTGPYSWIALEYVEGENLAQVLERIGPGSRQAWKRALRVGVHIGRALDFIHQKHFLHSNITPLNILIQTSDNVAKLSDLTLTKALEGSALQQAILEGKLLRELPFLAPEQIEGGFVDRVSDIYSLGVVVYALLTGRAPFLGRSAEETIARIQEGNPEKPTRYLRTIPQELERVVLRMLTRLPEDRYQTAGELVGVLEDLAGEEDVEV